MRKPRIFTTLAALGLSGAALQAPAADVGKAELAQAAIVFANSSIRDWQADDIHGMWVQDRFRRWYYAKLMSPCLGLDFATHVGFQTGGMDTLDKFSTVVVPGYGNCPLQSLTKSDAPQDRNHEGASAVVP